MFDAVRFQSFKCLADLTIELGRMTLLVGANASGKSSVLDGLHLLGQALVSQRNDDGEPEGRLSAIFAGPREPARLRTYGHDEMLRVEGYAGPAEKRACLLALEARPRPGFPDWKLVMEYLTPAGQLRSSTKPMPRGQFFDALAELELGPIVRLRLDSTRAAAFAPDARRPRVAPDGAGTAAVIAYLAEQRAPELDAIEADLRRVVPRARRLLPERAERDKVLGRLFSLEMDGGARIPADLLSEGTLLTIGLLTVLHGTPAPKLVLLDDFDRALHPTAQKQLVACVKDMLARRADLQFVCTTHSPYVLDLFDAEDVRVLRAGPDGLTRARRLTDHPEWSAWKGSLKPGEFWSFVGEDWLDASADAG